MALTDKEKAFLKIQKDKNVSMEDAFAKLNELKTSNVQIGGVDPKEKAPVTIGGIAKTVGKEVLGTTAGTIGGTTEFAGNLIKSGGKAISKAANVFNILGGQKEVKPIEKATSAVGGFIAEKGKEGFEASEDILGGDTVGGDIARFTAREIVAPAVTMGGIGKATAIPKVFQSAKSAPIFEKMIRGSIPTVSKSLARTEIQRGGATGDFASAQDIGIGLAADAIMGTASAALKKMAPQLFRIAANPTGKDSDQIVKRAANAVKEKYVGTANMMKNQAKNTLHKEGAKLGKVLAKDKSLTPITDLTKGLDDIAAENLSTGENSSANAIKKLKDIFLANNKENLTKPEVLGLKRKMANAVAKLFPKDQIDDLTVAGKKQAQMAIWKNADDVLNAVSPEVKQANMKMTTAFSILDPIEKSLKRPPFNADNILSILHVLPTKAIGSVGAQTADIAGRAIGSETARAGIRSTR